MYSESDIISVYSFLKDTPEGPLRNMLVGGAMTDGHFRLLMKIVRSCPQAQFIESFNNESVPKVKLTPAEYPLRENLWPLAKEKFVSLGLLTNSIKQAA